MIRVSRPGARILLLSSGNPGTNYGEERILLTSELLCRCLGKIFCEIPGLLLHFGVIEALPWATRVAQQNGIA